MKSQLTFGLVLIVGGFLLILHNLEIFAVSDQFLWGLAFVTIGMVMLVHNYRRSQRTGLLVLGIISCVIGISMIIDSFYIFPGEMIGAFLLWCLSAIFITIHLKKSENWWAIIPGGVFFILGAIIILNSLHLITDNRLWFVFMIGLSLIFWYLTLIKNELNKLHWAKYPAIVLSLLAFFILSVTWHSRMAELIFPISIIVLGLYLVLVQAAKQKKEI